MLRVRHNNILRSEYSPCGCQSTSSAQHNIITTWNPTSGVLHQQLLRHSAPHLYIRICVGICRGGAGSDCAVGKLSDAHLNHRRLIHSLYAIQSHHNSRVSSSLLSVTFCRMAQFIHLLPTVRSFLPARIHSGRCSSTCKATIRAVAVQ
jgi:hypothetical protein